MTLSAGLAAAASGAGLSGGRHFFHSKMKVRHSLFETVINVEPCQSCERYGERDSEGRPHRPPFAPIDDPHRQPHAERGEGDGQGGDEDVHFIWISETGDLKSLEVQNASSHAIGRSSLGLATVPQL